MSQPPESHPVVTVPAMISHLIPKYLDICQRDVSGLGDLLERSEFEEVQRRGHNLKGSGAAYGFVEASRLGGLLEQAAKARDVDTIVSLSADLARYFSTVEVRTT